MKQSLNIVKKNFDRFFKYFGQIRTDSKSHGIVATGFPIPMNFESSKYINFFPRYGEIRPPGYTLIHRKRNTAGRAAAEMRGLLSAPLSRKLLHFRRK